MYCPICNATETKVIDSRVLVEGKQVKRRRECLKCAMRFTTYEKSELTMPAIIKRDGKRTQFCEEKLKQGVLKSLEKRPISMEIIISSIEKIKDKIRTNSEREIVSNQIGEWVMHELKSIDEVAYVRFASVYRRFENVSEFNEEISRL